MKDLVEEIKFILKATGMVNLIGEQTDYNGGLVLPTALNMSVSIFLDKFEYNEDDYWLNYPKGYRLNGAYMFFEGSTHLKAGLLS